MVNKTRLPQGLGRLLPLAAVLLGVLLSVGVVFAGLPGPAARPQEAKLSGGAGSGRVASATTQVGRSPFGQVRPQPRPPQPVAGQVIDSPAIYRASESPASVLYDQLNGQTQYGINSQNYEPSLNVYDDQGADDFQIPSGQTWLIDQVEVAGGYLGTGPADSVNIYVYADTGLGPGASVITMTNLLYNNGANPGDFVIPVSPPLSLPSGAYWLSVQANQNFGDTGEWLWRFRSPYWGQTSRFRNPAGGFGQQFINWISNQCLFTPCYFGYAFRLDGSIAGTPVATSTPVATRTPSSPTATRTGTAFVPPPVITAVASVSTETPLPTETPPPNCGAAWRIEPVPTISPTPTAGPFLYGVSAISSVDVWSVGFYYAQGYVSVPQALHWDGSAWQGIPVPTPGLDIDELYSVSALAANDVWAVGDYDTAFAGQRPFIAHWDGTQWTESPNTAPPNVALSTLRSVKALAANDVWAVGSGIDSTSFQYKTLIEHWDGTHWSIVPSPNPVAMGGNILSSVTGLSSGDAWAVGYYYDLNGSGQWQTFIVHWNGSLWSVVPSPSVSGKYNILNSVDAYSANEVWAVGTSFDSYASLPLVLRWNGTQWTIAPGPDPAGPASQNPLQGVTVAGPDNVWVVGTYSTPSISTRTLTAHWDGTQWTTIPSPAPNTYNYLWGVDNAGPNLVWAVGLASGTADLSGMGLTIHYNDPCATPTPSSTPTSTPTNSPTVTSTPTLTATPSPTFTPCPISFSDVHTSDYFYEDVRCVYCLGAVSGYADGTFRPFNNTTRGQMAKIIVIALQIAIATPTGTPTFNDVLPGSAFYDYVETAAHNNIVSGYADGSFRPNNDVTRGQLSKIVVTAANHVFNWTILNPTTATFSDVQVGSAFFTYVETAVCHGVISGYADHTFRPGNNAIRAQIAKIVCRTSQNPPDTCSPSAIR